MLIFISIEHFFYKFLKEKIKNLRTHIKRE
jgi:hypothetical protein